MRIFDQVAPFSGKINFVDNRNCFVGFDMGSNCCESFGWFLSPKVHDTASSSELRALARQPPPDVENYYFDPNYFEEYPPAGQYAESGGLAVFRLVASRDLPPLYLHLFNHHNGYYSHGFYFAELSGSARILRKGYL